MRFKLFLIPLLFIAFCACTAAAPPKETSPPEEQQQGLTSLQVGEQQLSVELACTAAEQQQGLMHRKSLPENQGMLFVFEQERTLSFWMKNTLIPLSIAYIDKQGTIVDIQDMQPLDLSTHPSSKPAQYALEVNQGWFKQHGIQAGSAIKLDSFCSND